MQLWKCLGCDKEEMRSPSRMTRKRCFPCRVESYKGAGNPNFKDANKKVCQHCRIEFPHYSKTRKFCSIPCRDAAKPKKPPKPKVERKPKKVVEAKPPRESRKVCSKCNACGVEFTHFMSAKRRFCSYQCHVNSGGGWRAGIASSMAKRIYGAKKDANHQEVVEALRAFGASVIDTAHLGGGFPDLIVGNAGVTILVEIKNLKTAYGRRGLNQNQVKWKESWIGGPYAVVTDIESAIRAVSAVAPDPVATVNDVNGALRALKVLE